MAYKDKILCFIDDPEPVYEMSNPTPPEQIGPPPVFTALQTYSYDLLNRSKSAVENQSATQIWKQTFTYDRYGNRSFDTANNNTTTIPAGCAVAVCNPQVDPNTNKLVGYAFDNAGNTKTDASGRQFIYDGENKQVEVKDQSGASVGRYYYDGDGKRVKKITNTETTIFIYDASGKMVAEYSTDVASQQDAKVSYLTSDHLGSPRINTDANGAVISRHDYQPFGEEIQRASYGADTVRKQFTSYERDNETDLDFAQARMYMNKLGRFTSVDPLDPLLLEIKERIKFFSEPQRWNYYVYVTNNPLVYSDPSGLERYSKNVTEDQKKAIRETLEFIRDYGNKKAQKLAKNLLDSNILIDIGNPTKPSESNVTDIKGANDQIATGKMSVVDALGYSTLVISGGDMKAYENLAGALIHEGKHAEIDANILVSLTSLNPKDHQNESFLNNETRAEVAAAEFFAYQGGNFGKFGASLSLNDSVTYAVNPNLKNNLSKNPAITSRSGRLQELKGKGIMSRPEQLSKQAAAGAKATLN